MWILSAVLTVGSLSVSPYSHGKDYVARGNLIELVTPHHRAQPRHYHFLSRKESSHSPVMPNWTEGLVQHHSTIAAIAFTSWQVKSISIVPGVLFRARATIENSDLLNI